MLPSLLFSHRRILNVLFLLFSLLLANSTARAGGDAKGPPRLELRKGNRISIIGNTLADRLQHDGWLESYLYYRFPTHDLAFRNLGFSGDELTLRQRSANFGSPDSWLRKTKTDVVFAFFGYNESFAGEKGLAKFRATLDEFIKHTLNQAYSGKDNPRLVLFSPIAHEDHKDPNLSDGANTNKRLEMYTAVMAERAQANNVPFVDLFHATKELYAKSTTPLTFNGVHLTERGNQLVAEVIDRALFGGRTVKLDMAKLEKIRQAVLDRNFYWFNRYRTVDGYNVYGGRSKLEYKGITNRVVMDREMEVLDVMTANRDQRIWAVAQGRDLKVDDSNTPPFIPVETNKPGPLPGGKYPFLTGEEAIKHMTLSKGLKISLFADERQFPELVSPVQMAFDAKGRLWVAVWPTYPHWKPKEPMNDKLLVFEDTDDDGRADKMTVFADNLHCPTGFEFYNGGVLLAQAPDLIFLKDTDGDGKADLRQRVLHGLDSADTHHTANSFTFDPGGALYFQEGTFHHTQVETPYGPPVRCKNAGVFRYEPRTHKFDLYMNVGFANPHGHVFDRWGQDIVIDGTNAIPYHATLYTGQTADPDQRHPREAITIYKKKTRPCPAVEILSSRHFPEAMQGDLLVPNVIGFQGILRYKLSDDGASITGSEAEFLVRSADPNFRPADLKIGPDGALWFIDWHNPIIGHMQHHLRDPNRDHDHGRIYRITCEGRPLLKPAKIDGEPIDKLLDLLKLPEDRTRYRARIELGGRKTAEVLAAVEKWVARLDAKDKDHEHHLMEALWLHQSHNVISLPLLKRMLRSPDFRARAAATRVLCYWHDRVPESLDLLRVQITDTHPRVRLEAVRALSFFHTEAALGVAVELLSRPTDRYLNFTFNETLNTLERRLSTSATAKTRDIGQRLLAMLEAGKLDQERRATLIEALCRNGSARELKVIWERALDPKAYPLALRRHALDWLADAATTRRVQPTVAAAEMQRLLREVELAALPEALRLAAAWKVKSVAGEFQKIATDPKGDRKARFAAIEGLAALREPAGLGTLHELTGKEHPLAIQFHAAAMLAQVDLDAAARAAAAALTRPEQDVDPSALVQAFLNRKDGSDKLATALAKEKVVPDTAKRILRSMVEAGRSDAGLANVISKFAGLDVAPKPPTPAEVQQIAAEVPTRGDAARGEQVFRRADLGCIKCHAINKAGGNIGPDLGPIGRDSPLDYIITSVLDPNAAIKEEYLTKVITTADGQIVTGVVLERNQNVVVLKDATGKVVRIAAADIEREAPGKSLMPEGVARILTRAEMLDLFRFIAELGKPGPYAARTTPTIQRWKVLRTVTTALRDSIPDRAVLRDHVLGAGPEAWELAFTQVNGALPLAELHKTGQPDVFYLQGEIQVTQGGPVEIRLESSAPVTLWVGEEQHEKPGKLVVPLAPGRHRLTVRVEARRGTTPTLRVELGTPANSRARFDVVHGDD